MARGNRQVLAHAGGEAMRQSSSIVRGSLPRRTFLAGVGGAAAAGLGTGGLGWALATASPAGAQPRGRLVVDDPFTLGVASGDPLADRVVLWTRLAPRPLEGGGMPDRRVEVEWEVAHDERFRRVARRGVAVASPDRGHSVHVDVAGLAPARWYWYRFRALGNLSPVGRTRTAPAPGARTGRLRFAFASCQNYPSGYFAAYRAMAEDDLDVAFHLGDYIYEGGPTPTTIRSHDGDGEPETLVEYRNRHALYKTDPQLQAAHAAFPFVVTWDDHEIDNNWAGPVPQDPAQQTPEAFAARREAATLAYYENMPLRARPPRGSDLRLYRRLGFGDLVGFDVLDGRSYRSDQACGDPFIGPDCEGRTDPANTMLGQAQERWLVDGLRGSRARWNVLVNQTIFAPYDYDPAGGRSYNTDQWDGYAVQRQRLLDLFGSGRVANPVVITGDWHSSWVNELRSDPDDPASRIVGTELVGTSIASACSWAPRVAAAVEANPHVRFFDGDRRGYVRATVERSQLQADYVLLPVSTTSGVTVPSPTTPVEQVVSFVVPDGASVQPV
jgi:alkaline phosphatase D